MIVIWILSEGQIFAVLKNFSELFLMFAYFSAFDLPGRPYHGSCPFKK